MKACFCILLLVPILVLGVPNPLPGNAPAAAPAGAPAGTPALDQDKIVKYLKHYAGLKATNFDAGKNKDECEKQYVKAAASFVGRAIHHEADTPLDKFDIVEYLSCTREPPEVVNAYSNKLAEIFKDTKFKDVTDAIIKKTQEYCKSINYAGKTVTAESVGLSIKRDGTVGEPAKGATPAANSGAKSGTTPAAAPAAKSGTAPAAAPVAASGAKSAGKS